MQYIIYKERFNIVVAMELDGKEFRFIYTYYIYIIYTFIFLSFFTFYAISLHEYTLR